MRTFIRKNRGLAALLALFSIVGALTAGTQALFTDSAANGGNNVSVDAFSNHFEVTPGSAQQPGGTDPIATGDTDTLELDFGTAETNQTFTDVFVVENVSGETRTAELSTDDLPAQIASMQFATTPASNTVELDDGETAAVTVVTSGTTGTGSGSVTLNRAGQSFPARTYPIDIEVEAAGGGAPAAPTALEATAQANGNVALAWTASTTTGLDGYNVYRATDAGGPYTKINGATPVSGTSYTDTTSAFDTAYHYRVRAVKTGVESADSNTASVTTVPAAPSALNATAQANGNVALSWTASATSGVTYDVYRATDVAGPYTKINAAAVSGTTYTDTTSAFDTAYHYRVRAVKAGVESADSNTASVTTVPAAPSALTASGETNGNINLSWTASATSGVTYDVYRATSSGGTYSKINGAAVNATTFTDTTAAATTTYHYRVRAAKSGRESADSNTAAPPTVTAAVITKIEGRPNSTPGWIRNQGKYYVYANVTAGSSSISTVTADTSSIGPASASLTACSADCTVDGVTYGYVSAELTASNSLPHPRGFAITAMDAASQSRTLGDTASSSALTVGVDNTVPGFPSGNGNAISTVPLSGGTAARAEPGDKITFTYDEAIDGISVISNWFFPWTTITSDVRVTLVDGGTTDSLSLTTADGSVALPFGAVAFNSGGNYVSGGNVTFGGTGAATPSTLAVSGATFTMTLGSQNVPAGASLLTDPNNQRILWTPNVSSTAVYDPAGNRVTDNTQRQGNNNSVF